ncbi:hypothetical protein WJX73_000571 [Symbiochloris irregularis]|uniref:Cyclin-like domain-containing protein n=1 Tax=Symbiochloris irregularis TaxID=706552 RepID=A0AAW1NKR6_9CHLO
MLYTSLAGAFILSEEQLSNSPSRQAGVSEESERQLRLYGCELIQEGGYLLKLPQVVMATGQVLLHRFFSKASLVDYNIKRVAWACCWLATKLEEEPRRPQDLLSVFNRIDERREGTAEAVLDRFSQRYATLKNEIVEVERKILRKLGFILHVDHPHKSVLFYLSQQVLQAEPRLMQEAWNLANDSLRTTLCIRMRSEAIACGLIFMAARRLQIALPEDPPWWALSDVAEADLLTSTDNSSPPEGLGALETWLLGYLPWIRPLSPREHQDLDLLPCQTIESGGHWRSFFH